MGKVIYLDGKKRVKREIIYKKPVDYSLIVAVVLLLGLGLIMVFSSSYYAADFRENANDASFYFLKQLICVLIGAILMTGITFFDYHNYMEWPKDKFLWMGPLKKIRPYFWILALSLCTLLLVWVPGLGVTVNGSSRWINIGISIQPSEIVKFAVIIFVGCSIGRAPRRAQSFKEGILPYLILLLIIAVPIYFQPNFSAIICIAALIFIMLYVSGCKMWQFVTILLIGLAVVLVLVTAREYREDRVESISDPLSSYQLRQSLFSLGTGGLFGKGLGNSMQKYLWLPMSESDFIFAIIAEELGFVGAVFVMALYAFIIWRGVRIAIFAPDLTGRIIASGVIGIFTVQVLLNIAVVTAVIPTTGVVLPFVSYGGSSVLMFMCMIGLLLNVSRQKISKEELLKRNEETRERERERKTREKNTDRTPQPAPGRTPGRRQIDGWDI